MRAVESSLSPGTHLDGETGEATIDAKVKGKWLTSTSKLTLVYTHTLCNYARTHAKLTVN